MARKKTKKDEIEKIEETKQAKKTASTSSKSKRGRKPKNPLPIVENITELKLDNLNNVPEIVEQIPILKENLEYDIPSKTPLTLIERYVAELKLKGFSSKKIAEKIGVPEVVVKRTLNSKKVKEFINQISEEVKATIKADMIALMQRTIEDKIKYIEEKYDGDFSKATRKDLPDLLKMLDDMMKEEEKAKLGTTQNVFVNILNQVID